ncbi:MAG TPA: exonuclease domain-containing protein, partial [Burkholderiales bacterium]|nr:exonuclease domain-containing protein [Burkholderiales bacterium]
MNLKVKHALFVLGWFIFFAGITAAYVAIFWSTLDPAQQELLRPIVAERWDTVILLTAILLVALAFVLHPIMELYVNAPKKLLDEVLVIANANPTHRVTPVGCAEAKELAATINALADRYEASLTDQQARIADAKRSVEEEKNRLAALMSELTQSVIVCNLEGRILLYNARAKQLLTQPGEAVAQSLVGLGRSIFAIIDRNLIGHGLETLNERQAKNPGRPVAHFVTSTTSGQLIRAQMAPVVSAAKEITGYVLTLEDIRRTMETSVKRDQLLQSLTEGSRSALANIRAAVETLQSFPDMDAERQHQFIRVIGEEVSAISHRLDSVVHQHADSLKTQWALEDMLGSDLVAAAQRRIERRVGIPTKAVELAGPLWLRVDSYSLIQTLTYLASRLRDEFQVREVRFRLAAEGRHVHLDLMWSGATMSSQTLLTWEEEPMNLGGEASPLTLKEVLERHGGEVWFGVDKPSHTSYFRMLLPVAKPEEAAFAAAASYASRPEYYDFDLFHQPGQTPELDNRRLADLAYTVFDTETTGLQPSEGDEIISIGAVRVVNNRLLQHEV